MEIVTTDSTIVTARDSSTVGVLYLVEEFVDEDYKRDGVTDKCMAYFQAIKELPFYSGIVYIVTPDSVNSGGVKAKPTITGKLDIMPISFQDILKSNNWGRIQNARWLRDLWKAGLIRRFYQGLWDNAMKGHAKGTKWGVRYLWEK